MTQNNLRFNLDEMPKPSKSRGLPIWTVLIVLLVLAMVGLASLGGILYFTRSDKAKLERQLQAEETRQAQAKIDQQKAAENEKLTIARNRQDEVLAQTRSATNILGRLLQAINTLNADATALKSNEAGRSVATNPDLVAQARRLYESDIPGLATETETVGKLESVRRIEQQLVTAQGTIYTPAAEMAVSAQNASLWGEQELRKVAQVQNAVSGLVRESKIKVTSAAQTAASLTLEAAIQQLNEAESAMRQRAILEKTAVAKANAADTVGNAEAQRILEEARLKAGQIVADAQAAAAKQAREATVKHAESKVEDTKAALVAKQKEDDATRLKLREKASRPDIQNKLAPFITPGFVQISGQSYDKKPFSLKQLQSSGALAQTPQGLRALVMVASSRKDQIRPRWHLSQSWITKPGTELEMVKDVQQLLIELGPVLVEMEMLQP